MFFNSFFGGGRFDEDFYGHGFERHKQNGNTKRLYEILGVPTDATDNQIRKAYLVLAKQHHPDKGGDPKQVFVINFPKI